MIDKCKVYEQASRYVKALKYGFPARAAEFKENTKQLAKAQITNCVEPCKKEDWPLPSCCNAAYLRCGEDLILGQVTDDFKVLVRPQNGNITTIDGVKYVPFSDFAGEDEFTYISDGERVNVCVTVSQFDAEVKITPINGELIKREVVTECDATYKWHDGSTLPYNFLGPNEQWAVTVECDGCVKYFTECISCGADVPLFLGGETITEIVGFDGITTELNKAAGLITPDLQVAHNERYEDCGTPVVALDTSRGFAYTINDTPPLVEYIVLNHPAFEGEGWPATSGLKYWLGGDCYERSDYAVEFPQSFPNISNLGLGQFFYNAGSFTYSTLSSISYWATLQNEIKAALEGQGYMVGSVEITTQYNNYIIRIKETNAPLGKVIMSGSAGAQIFSFEKA